MIDSVKPNEWKRYLWVTIACFVIYVGLDIVPMIASGETNTKVIEKSAAERAATSFAEEQTGLQVKSAKAVHQTDKIMNGYLSKEELVKQYSDQYDERFPTDTYQIEIKFVEGSAGFVYVHMQNEKVTGWNLLVDGEPLSEDDQSKVIQAFLLDKGFRAEELKDGQITEGWEWSVNPAGYSIEESDLNLSITALSLNGEPVVTKYKPAFAAPSDYISYVKGQDKWAGFLTGFGYFFMSFVLFVLAIIYAVLYRRFITFKNGIALTVIYFITYIIINLNVLDGIRASLGENTGADQAVLITAIFTVLLTIPMAGSIYISLVAGDGLWKAQGRSVWPRFRDAGYGDYVWRSMGLSYLFAVILFALQAIIFIGLKFTIGTWGTSDVTQSPYNMTILWLMPVLAWAAAISEEAVFRLFGIGLFRRWFKNTFVAALFPTLFWALGHVLYPFYPSSTRLIELMIIGLVFSFIFVRYGFITSMFTHAIFNSVAVGILLLTIGSVPNILSAVFFTLLPLLIAYVIKALDKRKRLKQSFGG